MEFSTEKKYMTHDGMKARFVTSTTVDGEAGKLWCLNNNGMLQCGDTYEDFYSQNMSKIIEVPCPKSEYEFVNAVYNMLENRS